MRSCPSCSIGRTTSSSLLILSALFLAGRASATQVRVGLAHPDGMSVYKAAAASGGQDIWPFATMSDSVGFDGNSAVLRGGAGVYVDLFHGTPRVMQTDIALPNAGPGLYVGRSFNGVQVPDSTSPGTVNISGSRRDSDGWQGFNWFSGGRPELVRSWSGSVVGTSVDDRLYMIVGADQALEFKRAAASGTTFVGVNGTQGAILHTADGGGDPGLYEYRDTSGAVMTFFDFDGNASGAQGQLWKSQAADGAAGGTSYIGSSSTISTALAAFEQSSGLPTARPTTVYDSAGRRYTYTYNTFGGKTRVARVKAELNSGGWTEVTRVDYDYYTSTSSGKGVAGDLKTVTTTTPLSSGGDDVQTTYFRYYTAAYSSPSNPGHPHQLKLVMSAEAVRQYGGSYDSASDAALQSYAAGYFTYGSDARIETALFNGECGCGGGGMGGNGMYTLSLEYNPNFSGSWSDNTYDSSGNWTGAQWALRSIITTPDSHKIAYYFDEAGQVLGSVKSSTNSLTSGSFWMTKYHRDSSGRIVAVYTPAVGASSGGLYTHTTGGGTNGGTLAMGSTGLTQHKTYSGDMYLPSAVTQTEHSNGPGATKYADSVTVYTSSSTPGCYLDHGTARLARMLPTSSKRYVTNEVTIAGASSTDYNETTYSYTYHSSTWRVKSATTTLPVVTTGTNGSNAADTTVRYTDALGRTVFTKDELGRYAWTEYDSSTGQVLTSVDDPNSSNTTPNTASATWSISLSGSGLDRTTTHTYDIQGRHIGSVLTSGRETAMHYTKLSDGRLATVSTPAVTAVGGGTYYSPASYSVTNLASRQEATGTIGFTTGKTTTAMASWIDETQSDVVEAVATGVLKHLSTSTFDSTGTRHLTSTAYYNIDTTLAGSDGDTTTYAYDSMGRVSTRTDPTGTIDKTIYDSIGRKLESWTGTVDGGGSDNMTKISDVVYDAAGVGNSLVTLSTAYIQNSTTGRRDTNVAYDYRGRARYTQAAAAPHTVTSYDNLGRGLTTSRYSSTTSLSASTDPTANASNRVARSDRAYDARGQVWKSTRHEIIQSGGGAGNSNDTLNQLSWFDAAGKLIKSVGPSVTKYQYDRIGRQVRTFTVGINDDTTYAHAIVLGGNDLVVEESHTTYDGTTGLPIVRATIMRHPNASTSSYGALYSSTPGTSYAYGDISGRISITAMYHDELERVTDTAVYGTAGITVSAGSWSRTGSVPSRSDTILVTSSTFDTCGHVKDVTDPMGRVTQTTYDAAGHRTKVIENYVNGTAGGGTNNEEDRITDYHYTNGLLTSIEPVNATKGTQVTTYVYGVSRGSDGNLVSSNRLRSNEILPDSAGGTDKVILAYNALGQVIYRKDQAGNVIDTNYNTLGRVTAKVVSVVGGGFDTGTRAVGTSYNTRGQLDTVTQYSDTGMSTPTSQVQYTYDGWGNVGGFTQDVDGAIGGGGVPDQRVSFAYSKFAPSDGAAMLVRTSMTPPTASGDVIYHYNGTLAAAMGRVDELEYKGVTVATYSYVGAGRLIDTTLDEANATTGTISSNNFKASNTTYPNWDNFGRVIEDAWSRLGGNTYTDGKIEYDRNGNILAWTDELTRVQATGGSQYDHVFDAVYTNDGLNRLSKADEGKMTGSAGSRSIATSKHTRIEEYTLEQMGNWENQKLDLNGDGDQSDSDEKNWNSTFNDANEMTAWGAYSPTHDDAGNMTDDGRNYVYVYDAFNRLVKVTTRGGSPATVVEYKYNGLGYRTRWHYDIDGDADVDSSDKWISFFYDDRWRVVATTYDTDSNLKERFVYHAAGFGGRGGSSYIDLVVLRDVDDTNGWDYSSDGALEVREYFLQNWRADVVAVIQPGGDPIEYVRYSPYGVPSVFAAGDLNRDGVCDGADETAWSDLFNTETGSAKREADVNRDGAVSNTDDEPLVQGQSGSGLWASSGRGVLSRLGNRKGYAGYEWDPAVSVYHVRHRSYHPEMGRWMQRDPAGYVDGWDLYEYVGGRAVTSRDPSGMLSLLCEKDTNAQDCCMMDSLSPTVPGNIPDCPCSVGSPPANPDPAIWRDPNPADQAYHPGATTCMRSVAPCGQPGQQCCYDSKGALITDGPAAGTPDRYAPDCIAGVVKHYFVDVVPFQKCRDAGMLCAYFGFRTPNTGDGCPANQVGGAPSCRCECINGAPVTKK